MPVSNPRDYRLDGQTQVINISKEAIAAAQTDLEVGAVELRQPGVVKEIVISNTSSAGGASRATIQVTDGTDDLISADVTVVSGGSVEINETTTPSLVEAQQARDPGDRLQVDATTVAAEVVADLNVAISYRPTPRDS